MIKLGLRDRGVPEEEIHRYFEKVKALTGRAEETLLDEAGKQLSFTEVSPTDELTVADVQTVLKQAGFFPTGTIDGICGYRTMAAIRLFQEHVRTSGVGLESGVPNGILSDDWLQQLKRWGDDGLQADWDEHGTEHAQWIAFLERVKEHYADPANRTRQLRMVDNHPGPSDTRKVADWDFDPTKIHVVGVRRPLEAQTRPGLSVDDSEQKFDDVIVLLVHGMVFKFQGSTEPGFTKRGDGAPFLVHGQHEYGLGWHRGQYQALRPARHGVLVVRSKDDYVLTDEDHLNPDGTEKQLEANGTINVHWAGRGVRRNVRRWSEGCQVITGSGYIDHRGMPQSCAHFVALNNKEITDTQTRGAYNLMADLVAVFSSDASNRVDYMLLMEEDLQHSPEVASVLMTSREMARKMM